MAPIDTDLINYKCSIKRKYLFKYHFDVYKNISPHLKINEKKLLT